MGKKKQQPVLNIHMFTQDKSELERNFKYVGAYNICVKCIADKYEYDIMYIELANKKKYIYDIYEYNKLKHSFSFVTIDEISKRHPNGVLYIIDEAVTGDEEKYKEYKKKNK